MGLVGADLREAILILLGIPGRWESRHLSAINNYLQTKDASYDTVRRLVACMPVVKKAPCSERGIRRTSRAS